MRFFNYENLFIAANGNPDKMLKLISDEKLIQELLGHSWIKNLDSIVGSYLVSSRHKAEYIGLCALRDYSNYTKYGDTSLHIDLIPEYIPWKILVRENPLLTLTDNIIKFKYEE